MIGRRGHEMPRRCPSCSSVSFRRSRTFRGGAWATWECGGCGLHFIWPVPPEEVLAKYYLFARYANVSYPAESPGNEARESLVESLLEFAEGQPRKVGRLLDVGCSTGTLLEVARRRGWKIEGIERDPETAARASARLGICVMEGRDLASLPDGQLFDLIVLSHVLEHVRDPRELLRQVASRLDRDGRILIRVPNRGSRIPRTVGRLWTWFCPPIHLHYFDRESLVRLLGACELAMVRSELIKGDAQSFVGELLYSVTRLVAQARPERGQGREWPSGPAPGVVNSPSLRWARDLLERALSRFPLRVDDAELISVAEAA